MNKFVAILQIALALMLAVTTIATIINLIFISMRPETISVVNTIIGQGILVACMAALATVLFRKGSKQLRQESSESDQADSAP